jgi:ubiquinone/menaquinone biosynthesis C-methylase UbiE
VAHHDREARVLPPREGYDRAAAAYSKWHWTEFWQRNEAPLVQEWVDGRSGLGLDAGVGTGIYRRAPAAQMAVGVDLSASMLRENLMAGGPQPHRLIQADVQRLPFAADVFNWVLCTRVLSHVRSPSTVLAEFARVARAGADILITDVHPTHPYEEVSISTPEGKVAIDTYKHPIATLTSAVEAFDSLRISDMHEYRLHDLLWEPPRPQFDKIFRDPQVPVFYVLQLVVIA